MINETIISSFNDRPTLLEWLKKVEEALKSDTATGVSVENPSVNSYIFKITFADGKTIASEPVKLPDSVKGVSISNNHLIITTQGGIREDLGVINPYAETIVLNNETNTTEIGNNLQVNSNAEFRGNLLFGGSTISIQGMTKQNGILGTNAQGQIAFKEVSSGTQLYEHAITLTNLAKLTLITLRQDAFKDGGWRYGTYPALLVSVSGPSAPDVTTSFPMLSVQGPTILFKYIDGTNQVISYSFSIENINSESVTAL